MIIIGEKINSTRKSVDTAVRARDKEAIVAEALRQKEAGAHYLDVNCGTLNTEEEPEALTWLVRIVQEAIGLPLCIDSPNSEALAAGLAAHQGEALINSISGETERFNQVLPLVKQYDSSVVALCLNDQGIPRDCKSAIAVGDKLIQDLTSEGIALDRIYLDPLVRSLATSADTVMDTLELIRVLAQKYPGLHFVSGLSNVSYGLPERRHLNRAYVVMSVAAGLDAVIMDPLDKGMHAMIYAAEALVNRDRFCLNYIRAHNDGRLNV